MLCINGLHKAKVQLQATDQVITILDGATSELEVNIAQYTPPESSATSDVEVPCFTPKITSNTLLKSHNFPVPSNEKSKSVQK